MPLFSRHWSNPSTKQADPAILQAYGPALQIEISIPDELAAIFSQQGLPIPQPQIGTALIDTGASFTAIEESMLKALGLVPVGKMPIHTPQGTDIRSIYPCKLSFPGTPIDSMTFSSVTGCELTNFGHAALIGRDILSKYLLVYNGVDGVWTLAF